MVDNIPEHRTPDMAKNDLILHVQGQLKFIRARHKLGALLPQIYSASRRYLLQELRLLKQLHCIDAVAVREHHKRVDTFEVEAFGPQRN